MNGLANIGIDAEVIKFAGLIAVLIVLTSVGGWLGNIGWWGLIFLSLVVLVRWYGSSRTSTTGGTNGP